MRKNKYLLLIVLCLWLLIPQSGWAVSNPYPKTQNGVDNYNVPTIPCTYVAWEQAYERMGVALPAWGNAVNWFQKARTTGYSVGNTPKANSIAVYSGGCCGHVAYVISVDEANERMYIIQGGTYHFTTDENGNDQITAANGTGISEGYYGYKIGEAYGGRYLTGFIYLDNIPQNNTVPSTPSSSSSNTTPNTKKSSNSYLKNLIIENVDFDFNKDVFTYEVKVPNDVEQIVIKGEADQEKATISGLDNYTLKVGDNYLTIKVTAEDGSASEYNINVIREEAIVEDETLSAKENIKDSKKESQNNKMIFLISFIGLIGIIIVSLGIVIILKKRNKSKEI